MKLYIDIETYWNLGSKNDIKEFGATRCLADKTAGVNCIAYAIDNSPIVVIPYEDCRDINTLPDDFKRAFNVDEVVAHNVSFEQTILQRIFGFQADRKYFKDTMAKCLYYGYPAGLDNAAKVLRCSKLKDVQGKEAMKKLASGKFKPDDSPDLFNRLYSYCANDVAVMREIDGRLPDLPSAVQKQWQIDQEINQLGVPIDMHAINNAIWLKEEIAKQNDLRIQFLTDGAVKGINQTEKIVQWVNFHCWNILSDCTADSVDRALQKNLPVLVRQVLQLRQEAGLSSLAKYQKMANYQVNNRLPQMHFWYGAHTGRPTGSGPQVLNLPRSEESEIYAKLLVENPRMLLHTSKPAEKLKEGLRACICAGPGKMLVGMDLAQAEARNAGWLAGETKFLDLFTTTDPYCTYGRAIFGREIDKKNDPVERTASKASLLSLGFAGGIGAYQRVGENYKINFSIVDHAVRPTATPTELWEAQRSYKYYIDKRPFKPLSEADAIAVDILKQRYRRTFGRIVSYWDELENAFLNGRQAGPLTIHVHPDGLRVMTLPSGRELFYPQVEILPNGKYSYMGWEDGHWQRINIWKGTIMENACQAIAQDLSDWYKTKAHENIGKVVHHCYDEFTMEVDEKNLNAINFLKTLTNIKPSWAATLPLGFDFWSGKRYGK